LTRQRRALNSRILPEPQVREKDEMLGYVEGEVEELKEKFRAAEERLIRERDGLQAKCDAHEAAAAERSALADSLRAEASNSQRLLSDLREDAARRDTQLQEAIRAEKAAKRSVEETEGEMSRCVSRCVCVLVRTLTGAGHKKKTSRWTIDGCRVHHKWLFAPRNPTRAGEMRLLLEEMDRLKREHEDKVAQMSEVFKTLYKSPAKSSSSPRKKP
jgi:hypothetical protein